MDNDNENLGGESLEAESSGGENSGSESGQQQSESNQEFAIPQEYAEKGWAKNFEGKQGGELASEVFKSFDNSQSLVGKKVEEYLGSVDLKTLSNFEEIKSTLMSQIAPEYQVPENAADYSLNDILKDEEGNQAFEYPEEVLNRFAETFKTRGLNKEQAQGVLKDYTDFEMQEFQKMTNTEDLNSSLKTMFNGNTENRTKCESLIKEFISDEDQKFLQDSAPNKIIEIMYKMSKGFAEKYDYKEGNAGGGKGQSQLAMSQTEKDQKFDKLHDELMSLNSRPHTAEEKDSIRKQMIELQK